MAFPLALRPDFNADALRVEARRSRDGAQARRLLTLAAIYDGGTRCEAAKIGGVTLQILRDWVVCFNAEGSAGLISRKAPGSAPKLGAAERQALAQMVERGPIPAVHGGVRLAAGRSGAVGLGGVPHLDHHPDAEPRAAGLGLPQAVGAPAPSRARPPES